MISLSAPPQTRIAHYCNNMAYKHAGSSNMASNNNQRNKSACTGGAERSHPCMPRLTFSQPSILFAIRLPRWFASDDSPKDSWQLLWLTSWLWVCVLVGSTWQCNPSAARLLSRLFLPSDILLLLNKGHPLGTSNPSPLTLDTVYLCA